MTMQTELLSVTDNTVRTIEVRIGLTGAASRTSRGIDYRPHTLRVVYTKLGDAPWSVDDVVVSGYRLRKDGTLGQLPLVEPLSVRDGTISVSTDHVAHVASPALAALVIEHLPKEG